MIELWTHYYNQGWPDEQAYYCARYGDAGPIGVGLNVFDAIAQALHFARMGINGGK